MRISSLVRNAIFSIPAVYLVVRGAAGQGPGFADGRIYTPEFVFGVLISTGVAALLLCARQISIRQTEILRRLEILEVIGGTGGSIERNEAGDPSDGLPIGAVFPDFELPNAQGKLTSFQDLVGEMKPILFIFVAPTCQPCGALIPEIEQWQDELGERVNFIFVSRGTIEANEEKFSGEIDKSFLLQKVSELQDRVFAKWTPSALLVNTDGRVASHVAAGDASIRKLIDKITSENVDDPFFYFTASNGQRRPPKIGEPVPNFELKDLDGRLVVSDELRGKPTLVTFWSLTCPHCKEMMEQIKDWEKNGGREAANLLLFSDGDEDAHRRFGLSSTIIIDREYDTSMKFGMMGTPSGVLINENGRIASETAIGASNIWALIGRSVKN